MESSVQISVSNAVHPRERTYFSVVSTTLYASIFQPLGNRNTSFLISASAEERLDASTCSIGIRQSSINSRHSMAIMISPTFVRVDLIMPSLRRLFFREGFSITLIFPPPLPDPALAELLGKRVRHQQEKDADHALEQANRCAQ